MGAGVNGRNELSQARRIVVKIGSRMLASDPEMIPRLSTEVAALRAEKRSVVVVTSGAIAIGCHRLGYGARPKETARLQAAAAAGQSVLMRRYDEAREFSQKALEVSSEQPLALARHASIEAEGFRELERAKALAARAYSAAPSSTDVLDALGWVSHLAGDSVGALATLQRAAELAPENPVILYHLGAALLSVA